MPNLPTIDPIDPTLLEFNKAFLSYQSQLKPIVKTRRVCNRQGLLLYLTAPFDVIVEQVKELISSNGFIYHFTQELRERSVIVTCIVEHVGGYKKLSSFESVIMESDYSQPAYLVVGTSTLAMRKAFCQAFGIVTADEDPDSNAPEEEEKTKEPCSVAQIKAIRSLLSEIKFSEASILRQAKVDNLDELNYVTAGIIIERLQGLKVKTK